MYQPEIHETLIRVVVLETLDYDLTISEESYRSQYDVQGEIQIGTKATKGTVRDREYPPTHPLSFLGRLRDGDNGVVSSFPGTQLFVGLARSTPIEQSDEAYREDVFVEAVEVGGLPNNGNGTVEFDLDWSLSEARTSLADGEVRIDRKEYEIDGLLNNQLPIVIRANLYRDASKLARLERNREERRIARSEQELRGLAALEVQVEYRDIDGKDQGLMKTDVFSMKLSRTFPEIEFIPRGEANYDPGNQTVKWRGDPIRSGDATSFMILGPVSELLDVETISAQFRGTITGQTLSGIFIDGLFDESGTRLSDAADVKTAERVKITGDIQIDPDALSGDSREITDAKISVDVPPGRLYEELVDVCQRRGIHIRERSPPADVGDPVPGRDGVFEISEADAGKLEVRKEYADRGVVYGSLTVTGQYTARKEETEVSVFDESEDRLVRADKGGLETQGRSVVDFEVQSASSDLNSEFVSTIEDGISRSEY